GLPYAFASHFATAQLFDALDIYYNGFQPSEFLAQPYTIGCVNVIASDTDLKAERHFTSLIRMFLGVLTGKKEYLQPPVDMNPDLLGLLEHPAVKDMLRYSFYGSKETVKSQTLDFLKKTGVNEIMVVSNMYEHGARVNSYKIFSEIMTEINKS